MVLDATLVFQLLSSLFLIGFIYLICRILLNFYKRSKQEVRVGKIDKTRIKDL